MSMWLSATNSLAGAMRGVWTAELNRQQTAIAHEMVRQTTDFWTQSLECANHRPEAALITTAHKVEHYEIAILWFGRRARRGARRERAGTGRRPAPTHFVNHESVD
jgi:hypothetical protein